MPKPAPCTKKLELRASVLLMPSHIYKNHIKERSMRTARVACDSNIYHVIARGVGQQILFEDENDKLKFVSLMQSELTPHGKVFAWCLMSNHIHIIIRMAMTDLSLSMGKLLSRYLDFKTVHRQQRKAIGDVVPLGKQVIALVKPLAAAGTSVTPLAV